MDRSSEKNGREGHFTQILRESEVFFWDLKLRFVRLIKATAAQICHFAIFLDGRKNYVKHVSYRKLTIPA